MTPPHAGGKHGRENSKLAEMWPCGREGLELASRSGTELLGTSETEGSGPRRGGGVAKDGTEDVCGSPKCPSPRRGSMQLCGRRMAACTPDAGTRIRCHHASVNGHDHWCSGSASGAETAWATAKTTGDTTLTESTISSVGRKRQRKFRSPPPMANAIVSWIRLVLTPLTALRSRSRTTFDDLTPPGIHVAREWVCSVALVRRKQLTSPGYESDGASL